MKIKGHHSKRSRHSTPSLASRLAAYSATAGAALTVIPAGAQVVNITDFSYNSFAHTTTPPVLTIAPGSQELGFAAGLFHGTFEGGGGSAGSVGAEVELRGFVLAGTNHLLLKLPFGHAIAENAPIHFLSSSAGSLARNFTSASPRGQFLPGANGAVTGYAGFRTFANGNTYYGWLNVKVTADANGFPSEATLVAVAGHPGVFGAYGPAGTTAGELAVTPEPGTVAIGGLGLLALGARGIRELRRRRATTAKN